MTFATHALGIDVGGTTIKAIVATRAGEIVKKWQVPTPQEGAEAVVSGVAALVKQITTEISFDGECATWVFAPVVTVAVPGIVDDDSGMAELSVNLGWQDFPMRDALRAALGREVYLTHDVRAGAFAESRWGVEAQSFFYVPIGTGIAAAMIIKGKIFSPHPWAGEFGQLPVADPDHPGQMKPLEQVCSAAGMANRLRAVQPDVPEDAGAREVYDLADAGNGDAQRIITTAIQTLGETLAVVAHILGPIPVVIGGGLAGSGEDVTIPLARAMKLPGSILPEPEILVARLGSWSQALGTAALSFDLSDDAD